MNASRVRALVKFTFWAIATVAVFTYAIRSYTSGTMVHWYYFQARADGYAVNTRAFADATPDRPALLTIGAFDRLDGLQAAPVKEGQILPQQATGVIDAATIEEGRRVRLDGDRLAILVPFELKEAKGFKFRDTFAHKNIGTNPVSGVWNLVMVGLVGLCLGYLAEAFTDMLGIKFAKIDHSIGH
jgi:hypothetical protein